MKCAQSIWRLSWIPKKRDTIKIGLSVVNLQSLSQTLMILNTFLPTVSLFNMDNTLLIKLTFITLDAHHRFCGEEIDWGFTRYHDIKTLTGGKEPFINSKNQTVISIFLRVVKDETGVLWRNLTK